MTSCRRLLLAIVAGFFLSCSLALAQEGPDLPGPIPLSPSASSRAPAASSSSFLDDWFPRYVPRVGYNYDVGDTVGRESGGLSSVQAFVPLWQDRSSTRLLFSDSRLLVFDTKGAVGANLGLGGRMFSDMLGRTLGGYLYWDYTDTGRASFKQVSGGVESLGTHVDARANFYVPVGKDRKQVDLFYLPNTEPTFQNNYLLLGGGQGLRFLEQALCGFDTEAGLKVFATDTLELRAFAGMYHYQGETAQQAWGPRGRVEARIRDILAMGVSIQNDRLFGTTLNLNVLVTFPRLSGRRWSDGPAAPLEGSDRLGDPVVRLPHVAVDRQQHRFVVPGKPVVDPLTGQPLLFLHVAQGGNSDGSVENPYGSLAAAFADPRFAQGNVVVYDRTLGTFSGKVNFAPGTRLLSSGPVQVIETLDAGRIRLPFSGASPDLNKVPTVQGTIILASHSTVSGFQVSGGKNAVAAPDARVIRNVAIVENKMTSVGGPTISLPSVTGVVEIRDNRIDMPGGTGISVGVQGNGATVLTIRDNQVTRPRGDGITVGVNTLDGGTAAVLARVHDNAIEGALGHGIFLVAAGKGSTQAELARNVVRQTEKNGIHLETASTSQATVRATIQSNTVTASGTGASEGAITLETVGTLTLANLLASVSHNNLRNNSAPGVTARSAGNNSLTLELFSNTAVSPLSMFGFVLQQQGASTFDAVQTATLGSRNVGGVMTAGTINSVAVFP